MERTSYGIAPPGQRLPAEAAVGRVTLQIGDLARSLDYYTSVLGFEAIEQRGGATLAAAGGADPIVDLHERPGTRPVPRGGRLGLYHFAVLLPERRALARFVRNLLQRQVRFASADHYVSEAIYLWDPDGLGIEVYADRPRSSWQTSGRELHMGTEPLDVQGLLADAGSEPWSGLPLGTTMGHVHLSVGDLEAARAFYHEALGFDLTVWRYPGALFMSAGGYHHHLGTNTWAAHAAPAADDEARLLEWELRLPSPGDVQAAATSVRSAGHAVASTGSDQISRDPWNVAVRLTARAPSSA